MITCVENSAPVLSAPSQEHKHAVERDLVNDKQLQAELEQYVLPKLTLCYFPSAIYPLADAVYESVGLWLRRQRIDTLFDDEKIFQKFLAHRIEELALRTHPTARLTRIRWLSNLYAVFCVLDDKVDDTADGLSPETSIPYFLEFHLIMFWSFPKATRHLVQNMLDIIDSPAQRKSTAELFDTVLAKAETQPGTDYPGEVSPLSSGFRELWSQASGDSPPEWGVRFARECQRFLLGLLQETKNRDRQFLPSIQEYIKMRRTTGCMRVVVGVCTGYVADAHLPEDIFSSPKVDRMLDVASDITNWTNDIYSLPKELKKGDMHNLVLLICEEQKCSLNAAAKKVAEMVEEACEELRSIGEELQHKTAPEYRSAVATLTEKCFLHAKGFLNVHRTSPRYYSLAREVNERELARELSEKSASAN